MITRIVQLLGLLLVCTTDLAFAGNGKSYYDILGVRKNATNKEIKKAYFSKAKEYHPDTSQDENATRIFQEISEAYEILSDEETKDIYDKYGKEGLDRHKQGGSPGADPFDPFEFMRSFGGFGGGSSHGRTQTHVTTIPMMVTLEELYRGVDNDIDVEVERLCAKYRKCERKRDDCIAPGVKVEVKRIQIMGGISMTQMQSADSSCVSRGIGWVENCSYCPDGIYSNHSQNIFVTVAPGSSNGDIIRFPEIGRDILGQQRGDLNVQLVQVAHPIYSRKGDDLHVKLRLKLDDAIAGFKYELPSLSDDPIILERSEPVAHGETETIRGKGMPIGRNGQFGKMVVTYDVMFPKSISKEASVELRRLLSGVDEWKHST